MARTAEQMPRPLLSLDIGAFLRAAFPLAHLNATAGGALLRGDDLTARAVACSGLVALFGLPFLMLASVVLDAPLAAPAAIAVGYLAMSYALSSQRARGAAIINAAVLAGLVAWLLSFMLMREGLSQAGFVAALLAPLFAAAPAVARLAIAPRSDPAVGAAESDAACLDRLAPAEAVLLVRRDGTMIAATRAARARLKISHDAVGRDVGRCFGIVDRPKLAEAIAQCRPDMGPTEVSLSAGDGRGSVAGFTAEISAAGPGAVSIRLRPSIITTPRQEQNTLMLGRSREPEAETKVGPAYDLGDALAFARGRSEPSARAKGVRLETEAEDGIRVVVDRQLCRRIVHLMIECALRRCETGDALRLTMRSLRSVALLQVAVAPGTIGGEPARARAPGEFAALREAAEAGDGTLVVEELQDMLRLSVRLALAPAPATNERAR